MRSAALVVVLICPALALAQDSILLSEVMPDLAGTELGDVPIAEAPPTGSTLVVRRSDIRRALERAHQSGDGLDIPKSTRISRKRVQLSVETFVDAHRPALAEAAAPCSVQEVTGPKSVSLSEGRRETRVEIATGRRTGRVSGSVIVQSGTRQTRVPLTLKLLCPEPEINSGKQVNLVVRVGNVRVTTQGEARQPGRAGDIIRVTSHANNASLRGRVIDAQTVEVVP